MKHNLSLLKLLFGAFFVLHIANVKPFADWSLWLIFAVLALHYVRAFISKYIVETGLDVKFWGEMRLIDYQIRLANGIRAAKKQQKQNDGKTKTVK